MIKVGDSWFPVLIDGKGIIEKSNTEKSKIYGMNDVTSFTEEDFKNAPELKLTSELERLKEEAVFIQSLGKRPELQEPKPLKPASARKPFHNYGLFFRSEDSPDVYKLSGDLSTFDERDIQFNNNLPQRVLNDYLEHERKKCIDELSNKDLLKTPFLTKKETKTKDELVGILDEDLLEVPKPPPKWKKFADKDGDVYYYNIVTKVTQWNKPDNFESDGVDSSFRLE